MRNALIFLLLAVSTALLGQRALALDTNKQLNYIAPANGVGGLDTDDIHQLLPIRGSDLPPLAVHDVNDRYPAVAQPSVVEAIPTPTAFQAGLLLMITLLIARVVRKIRVA